MAEKRWYYTDPLAAAWMAKHFGMFFSNDLPKGQHHCFQLVGVNKGWQSASPYQLLIPFRGERRFVIHPDSLHLLEPQDWDVLYGPCGGEVYTVRQHPQESSRYPETSVEDAEQAIREAGWKLIQRDDKPFHWPDREV